VFVSLLSAVVALAASLLLTSVPLMKVERYSLAFYPDSTRKVNIGIAAAACPQRRQRTFFSSPSFQSPYLKIHGHNVAQTSTFASTTPIVFQGLEEEFH
jgi:hypothetical protein